MNKRKTVIVILLVVLLTLSGCGMKSSHANAIKNAIMEYSDYYIEVDNLNAQIRKQARALTGYEDQASYTLDIEVPDYSLIDVNSVSYDIPAIDWLNPDADAYMNSLGDAIRRSVEAYALANPLEGYVGTTLAFDLTLEDGKWTGKVNAKSEKELAALIDGMMDKKAAELKTLPKEYDYVRVAEKKNELFSSLIEGKSYIDAIAVTGVDDLGGGQYRLNVSYPDPAAAFTALGNAFVSSYTERIFGSIDCTLNPNDFDAASLQVSKKNSSITVSMDGSGNCSVVDGQAFADEYAAALASAETAAAEEATEKYGIPEVAVPASSAILYGASTGGSEFRARLSGLCPSTYFCLYRINDNIEEEGTLQIGIFVLNNNRTFSVSIPAGNYKFVTCYGDTWYGPEYLFGPEGTYVYRKDVITIKEGYYSQWDNDRPWDWYNNFADYGYDADPNA